MASCLIPATELILVPCDIENDCAIPGYELVVICEQLFIDVKIVIQIATYQNNIIV